MEILQESITSNSNKSFLSHVFSTTEESKAEILNIVQYSLMGIIPIVILNKLIQRFIPEADPDKSSLELLAEIFIQITVMFCGIVIIHRMITYFPTYSGFKYENLALTNIILAFLIIVLSLQTKLGIKVGILYDNVLELWEGSPNNKKDIIKKNVRISNQNSKHIPSQADYLDNPSVQTNIFPPAPVSGNSNNQESHNYMMPTSNVSVMQPNDMFQPMAANSVLGNFGSW
jgi:hypothetical protein